LLVFSGHATENNETTSYTLIDAAKEEIRGKKELLFEEQEDKCDDATLSIL
jgi:hypothetical protein